MSAEVWYRAAVKYSDEKITRSRWTRDRNSAWHAYILSIRIAFDVPGSANTFHSFWIEKEHPFTSEISIQDKVTFIDVLHNELSSDFEVY